MDGFGVFCTEKLGVGFIVCSDGFAEAIKLNNRFHGLYLIVVSQVLASQY